MFFDTGSVSKRKSELSPTSVIIKRKEGQSKISSPLVSLGIYNPISKKLDGKLCLVELKADG